MATPNEPDDLAAGLDAALLVAIQNVLDHLDSFTAADLDRLYGHAADLQSALEDEWAMRDHAPADGGVVVL